ncbi:MAG: methenyltetrahydrofolate cyclohydrolase [Syntrophobacteraceae bacterium CG07_land_8_20_14_0_80_61_8]|nr:MAG: methenyltetrahydrofolate cyclohydrolase [Syntrophobacteraceae bacterium CG07_land_8_20_14_0_80_61_8]
MELRSLTVDGFVAAVASGDPTPGGGSVGALCGALGAALTRMVCGLTLEREKFRDSWTELEPVARESSQLRQRFLDLVQDDTDAYQTVLTAFALPQGTSEQQEQRRQAVEQAMQGAASVPLATLGAAAKLIGFCETAIRRGNPNTLTDAGVAAQMALAAGRAAAYNVRINLTLIRDEAFTAAARAETARLLAAVEETAERCDRLVMDRL